MSIQKTVLSLLLVTLSVSVLFFAVQKRTTIESELKQYQSLSSYNPVNWQCSSENQSCGDPVESAISIPCCKGLVCTTTNWDNKCVPIQTKN
ncbi:hypothetical protein ABPG72_020585 [Tetrahymena utriculariae]